MAGVIPNAGEARILSNGLGKTASENILLKLFSNNVTPGESDTASTYTELANGNGYTTGGITLASANWTVTGGDPTTAVYAKQTWNFTGAAGNVYGYYLVGATSGILYGAEKFTDGPYNMQNNGDNISVTPTLNLA